MSELVKKLFDEAIFDPERLVGGVYHPDIPLQFNDKPLRFYITTEQYQKFAQSIINECNKAIKNDYSNASLCEDVIYNPSEIEFIINEHFGINK